MIDFLKAFKWYLLPFLVIIPSIVIILIYNTKTDTPGTPPTPSQDLYPTPFLITSKPLVKTSPLQQTEIGKTTATEVENLPNLLRKDQQPDGAMVYSFKSSLTPRPIKIITKNDRVIFESMLTPEKSSAEGYAKTDDYLNKFGSPNSIIKGSKFYGWYMEQWVYASKGFTLIVNPNTKEVYEIQAYQPMSADAYVKYYGDDITQNASPPKE